MKILIVDDELPARRRLLRLLRACGVREEVREAADGLEAFRLASRAPADLVLLDIRMPGMDGLEAAGHLARLVPPPAVVFTTAYEAHALEAFAVNAVDYLVKPVTQGQLQRALERARAPNRAQLAALAERRQARRSYLGGRQSGSLRLAPVVEIRYFRAEHKYVEAVAPESVLLLEESLKDLEREFAPDFLRVHRNALAAMRHVRALEPAAGCSHLLRFRGLEGAIPVSRRLLAEVRRRLQSG